MEASPRSFAERKRDVLARLEGDIDAWIATADAASGTPYLIPLSFLWDGESMLLSTPASSPTSRNLQASAQVRVGVGLTRDVVLIEGAVETITPEHLPMAIGDAFAARTGFDPRQLTSPYLYFRVRPRSIQAWRETNEINGRTLMRNGLWLEP